MKRLLSLVLLLNFASISAKPKLVTILGENVQLTDSTDVFLCPLIGQYPNEFYQIKLNRPSRGKFAIQIAQLTDGFISLESKYFRYNLYAVPGDTIVIKTDVKGNTTFSGTNSAVNQFLNVSHSTGGPVMDAAIDSVLSSAMNANEAVGKFDTLLARFKRPIDSLRNTGKVNPLSIERLYTDKKAVFLFIAFFDLIGAYEHQKKGDFTGSMDSVDIKAICDSLSIKYSIWDGSLRTAPSFSVVLSGACSAINKGLMSGTYHNEAGWRQFDTKHLYYAYAPANLHEYLMGNSITIKYRYLDQNIIADAQVFKSLFPKSPYVAVFDEWTRTYLSSAHSTKDPTTEVATYQSKNDSIVAKSIIAYKSIDEILKDRFPGKAVFVDCWATWCSPCKAEFKFEPKLNAFLQSKDIEILYIAMDQKGSEDNWFKSIHTFQLNGTHVMASDTLRDNMSKMLDAAVLGVPRYLLFNNKGELVEANALRPSSEVELFKQITERLKLN